VVPDGGRRAILRELVVQDVAPVGERRVGGDGGGTLVRVPVGDDLVKEVGVLLIQREVTESVADEERGLGIDFELAHQRVIDLRSQQMVQHVHGSGEQDAVIGLAGTPADDFGQHGFAHARIANKHEVSALEQEVQIQQLENTSLACWRDLWWAKLKESMEYCACSRDILTRRSTERRRRASSSRSASRSRVAAKLRLLVAASAMV